MQGSLERLQHALSGDLSELLKLPIFTPVDGYKGPVETLTIVENYRIYTATYPVCLANVLARVDSEQARIPLVENLWDEHGRGDISEAHRGKMDAFAHSLRRTFGIHTTDPKVRLLESTEAAARQLEAATTSSAMKGLGAILAMEFTNPPQMAALLAGPFCNLPSATDMRYIVEHQALDDEHAVQIAASVDSLAKSHADLALVEEGALEAISADYIFWHGLSEHLGTASDL